MSRAEARQLADVWAAAHDLAGRCPTWLPHVEESQAGGVVVVFTVAPGLECLVFCNHRIWMYRTDHVSADGRILEMGEPITLGFGTDIPKLMNRISVALRERYVLLLASPAMQAAPAEDSGVAFISEALWHLDGRRPLNGRPPSLYGRDPAMKSGARNLELMTRAATILNQRCPVWNPRLAETNDGGVSVLIDFFPGWRYVIQFDHSSWTLRRDHVDDDGSLLEEGTAHRLDRGTGLDVTMNAIATAFRNQYEAVLATPGAELLRAEHPGLLFASEALWHLDGRPPLNGQPPSVYRR